MNGGELSYEKLKAENKRLQNRIENLERNEERIRKVEEILRIVSTRFVSYMDVDEAINASLADIASFSGANKASLFLFSDDGKKMRNTHEWYTREITPVVENSQDIPFYNFSWWMKRLRENQPIYIEDLSDMPEEARYEKEMLEMLQIKSTLVYPVHIGKVLSGFIGFSNVIETRHWQEEDMRLLQISADIIGNALERKRIEEKEQDTETIFRKISENLQEGLFRTEKGIFTYVNQAVCQITGYREDELIGMPAWNLACEDKRAEIKNNFTKKAQNKDKTPVEICTQRKDNTLVWAEVRFSHFLGERDIFGFILDITERKKAEASIRESEERYRTIVENTNDSLIIHDFRGKINFVNDNACQLLGYPRKELLEAGLELIHSPKVRPSIERMIENEAWEDQTLLETELISKQGLTIPVEISSKIISYKGEGNIQTFIRDITKRKQAEQALQESEEMFRTFVSHSSDGIRMADENGKIFFVNEAHEKITGYHEKEVIGQYIWDLAYLMLPEERKTQDQYESIKKAMTDAINGCSEQSFDQPHIINARTRQGHTVQIQEVAFKINTTQGLRLGAIIRDITRLKKQEEELRKLNATKDKLFSIIAHDLRNPFNSILGFSELVMKNVKNQKYDKLERYCENIYHSARQSYDLLNNLLQWSRVQRGKMDFQPEELNLASVVNQITDLMKGNMEEKDIDFCTKVETDLTVHADRFMFETILRNLFSNAIKFTCSQGRITIKAYQQEKQTVISVQDTGVGMPQETADKLFNIESTFSTPGTNKEKGTGLGLILCRDFVEKHGGTIWVESEVNRGSTFSFTIPFRQPVRPGSNDTTKT
jgi:PAS domain S-box-containing protein